MGKEVKCDIESGMARGPVKAHLDGEHLRLTGTVRLIAPLADIRALEVRGDALHFQVGKERFALALGAKPASAWALAIAKPKSLLDKLEVKPEQRVCVLGFDDDFAASIASATRTKPAASLRGTFDAIFRAIEDEDDLAELPVYKKHLRPAATLWLVSPKGKGTPVREQAVRAAILDSGLVDTKVVSFSATHSAVKAVIRLADRPGA